MSTRPKLQHAFEHGRRVAPMRVGVPGSSDAVEHTVRHFLQVQEEWDRLEPQSALSPVAVREELPREWDPSAFSSWSEAQQRRVHDLKWWQPPRVEIVTRAHDLGYYPRYRELVRMAGAYLEPGSAWSKGQTAKRIRADVGGCIVAGDLHDDRFQVLTAYRSALIRNRSNQTFGSLGDRLKARCQELRAAASPHPERRP